MISCLVMEARMLSDFIECLFLFTIRLPRHRKCIAYIGYIYYKTFAIWIQKADIDFKIFQNVIVKANHLKINYIVNYFRSVDSQR